MPLRPNAPIPTPGLFSPARALVSRSPAPKSPGLCESDQKDIGWFVPVRDTPHRGAFLRLLIRDRDSGFVGTLDFLVDTGAERTIIPRRALSRRGRRRRRPFEPKPGVRSTIVWAWNGAPTLGSLYQTSFALICDPPTNSFDFGSIPAIITDDADKDAPAVLGLDLLKQLIVVAAAEHFTFWPGASGGPTGHVPCDSNPPGN
jgi:hypothetical protein